MQLIIFRPDFSLPPIFDRIKTLSSITTSPLHVPSRLQKLKRSLPLIPHTKSLAPASSLARPYAYRRAPVQVSNVGWSKGFLWSFTERKKNFKIGIFFRKPFSFISLRLLMQSIDGYIGYTRREYCNDVKCPIQLLLNKEVEKSPEYEEIRAICASNCLHSTHEFHHWLTGKGYFVVRPEHK